MEPLCCSTPGACKLLPSHKPQLSPKRRQQNPETHRIQAQKPEPKQPACDRDRARPPRSETLPVPGWSPSASARPRGSEAAAPRLRSAG